jgi:hypothetical protein
LQGKIAAGAQKLAAKVHADGVVRWRDYCRNTMSKAQRELSVEILEYALSEGWVVSSEVGDKVGQTGLEIRPGPVSRQ